MEILIGSDPEVFVKKAGELVSGFNLIPGNKVNPHKVNLGAVQVDGMALEFNIDPAATEQAFVHNINAVLAQLRGMVPEHELAIQPVAEFGQEYISQQPEEARELGCDPDFNAWRDGDINTPPLEELPFRTGAGHVHIGWTSGANIEDPSHVAMCCSLIKQLDFFLGLPSLFYDDDAKRRTMYGQAGAYRSKPYGVEYRVLSNAWLKSDELIAWVFRATSKAIEELNAGNFLWEKYGDIQNIINTSDGEAASEIIEAEGLEVPNVG